MLARYDEQINYLICASDLPGYRRVRHRRPAMPGTPSPKYFGPNVRRLRIEAGMTQAQLAAAADLADATVSRIERNRLVPSIRLAERIARSLGPDVTVDRLFGPPERREKPAKMRPSVSRLIAVVRGVDDAVVDDITRALKLLLAAGRRSAKGG